MKLEIVHMPFVTGTTHLPRPLGIWKQDPDGGWWEEHTPYRTLDGNGISESPYEPLVRVYGDVAALKALYGVRMLLPHAGYVQRQAAERRTPWWQFWKGRGGLKLKG